eukprot:5908563-Amphidinium_carterae.1
MSTLDIADIRRSRLLSLLSPHRHLNVVCFCWRPGRRTCLRVRFRYLFGQGLTSPSPLILLQPLSTSSVLFHEFRYSVTAFIGVRMLRFAGGDNLRTSLAPYCGVVTLYVVSSNVAASGCQGGHLQRHIWNRHSWFCHTFTCLWRILRPRWVPRSSHQFLPKRTGPSLKWGNPSKPRRLLNAVRSEHHQVSGPCMVSQVEASL